ncbi:U32 family peptidase [Agrilactobacillus composti DSM 18527 = JCM 14202]|uniref:U32 family peptidase n=1 Tax=Agrilactobacillus composti DSM 18527 = JCM 14202 TaxID=1423734 RepID=X0PTX3_9LACO|nr:U32 family peptidase [Agrilactobacillus composti]KRM32634.1 U32 family peptidase [Agrilactobacillus composti DSM 18527 = JCM 14202]GAF41487.1 peptidase, U32 family large subunit [Agrilactobacillus composti DSM 18527 = JCM 14202]
MIKNKPEVLAPAGTMEKLKVAIDYGADAVYIGGDAYGLRSRAGNFSFAEMAEGAAYAHAHQAKVYVAANIVAHEGDIQGAGDYFRQVRDHHIDAVIVSDPSLIEIAITQAPGLAVHLSTQASATNWETLKFWQDLGLERIVLAREVGLDEIKEIRKHTDIEIEAFIHGAMCIGYSGRCVLSNHMGLRDANRGGCAQNCRWKYDLYEMPVLGDKTELLGENADGKVEDFSMSAVDMAMIEHIPELIEAGVNSLKIEGRMKTVHYVSTVSNVYHKAVSDYCADPVNYQLDEALVDELWKVAQREMSTGFYFNTPTADDELFGKRRKRPQFKFIGQVLAYDAQAQVVTVQQRNNFGIGDQIEFYGPNFTHYHQTVTELFDEDDLAIERAPHAMQVVHFNCPYPVQTGDFIRAQAIEKPARVQR